MNHQRWHERASNNIVIGVVGYVVSQLSLFYRRCLSLLGI